MALTVSLCVAWTPWALTWGDAFSDAAAAGRSAGAAAAAAVPLPTTADGSVVMPGSAGGNLSFGAVFPGSSGGDPADFAALYGHHEGVLIRGQQAQIDLRSSNSPTGEAYRAVRASVGRSHPDMRVDPLWAQTDYMLENFAAIPQLFSDCTTQTTFINSRRQTHIADYRTCNRLVEQGGICSWYHDYLLPQARTFGVTASGPGVQVDSCGYDCVRVTLSREEGEGGEMRGEIHVGEPTRVRSVAVDVDVSSPQLPPLPEGYSAPRTEHFTFTWFGGLYVFHHVPDAPLRVTGADVTETMVDGGDVLVLAEKRLVARPDGCFDDTLCDEIVHRAYPAVTLVFEYRFQPDTQPQRDLWGPNDGCYDLLNAVRSGSCPGTVECLGAPPLEADGCYYDTGVRVCAKDLGPPPVAGQNPFCREIRVSADCEAARTAECLELEQDPACGFISSKCVEGALGPRGNCQVFSETWDCGAMRSVPSLTRVHSMDCAGPVRCMGTECASFPSEQSTDFAQAAAALQAVQMAVTDMQCTPGGECLVFGGESGECKRSVGGVVNCCKTPEGINLGDYINLIFAVGKIDSAIMGAQKGSAVRGAWETLRQPVSWTWNTVKESFTSVANNLMANTGASASDVVAHLSLDAAKQALLRQTAQWAVKVFGDAAVNSLFSIVGGGQAVTDGTVNKGVLQLGGGQAWIGTAMTWAMYAYMIYTVTMILIKIIWTCEKEEFELGAKRELRSCHAIGNYCKKDVLGLCVETRDSYCCFNTPLSRIINEQIRPQLDRGWGPAKSPDCTGISITDLARIDWSQVDLSEWLSILLETGHFPTAETLTMDQLTGSGSELAIQGQGREDAATRSVRRTQGLDSDQLRQDSQYELWGGALNTLP